jgi:hypothetical protein
VFSAGADSVIFLNKRIKNGREVLVRIPITSIDTAVLVVELNSASNGLSKGESRSLGLDVLEFIPFLLGDMLGNKGVLRADEGEISEVLLLVLFIFLPQFVDTINHLLYKLNLRVSQSVLVGDVISVSSLATRFSTGTTGLKVKFFTASLELRNSMLGPSGKVNMDGSSHTSTQVGWARVDITILSIKAEIFS